MLLHSVCAVNPPRHSWEAMCECVGGQQHPLLGGSSTVIGCRDPVTGASLRLSAEPEPGAPAALGLHPKRAVSCEASGGEVSPPACLRVWS